MAKKTDADTGSGAGAGEGSNTATTETAGAGAPKTVPGLSVRAIPEDGFNRGGRYWPHDTKNVALSDLTEAQVKQIRAEGKKKRGKLVVADVEVPAPKEKKK